MGAPPAQPQVTHKKNNVKSQSMDVKLKAPSCTAAKPKKNSLKAASRKRAYTDDISSSTTLIPSIIKSPANKDSVGMTIVEKGKLTTDDASNKDTVVRSKSPVTNSNK